MGIGGGVVMRKYAVWAVFPEIKRGFEAEFEASCAFDEDTIEEFAMVVKRYVSGSRAGRQWWRDHARIDWDRFLASKEATIRWNSIGISFDVQPTDEPRMIVEEVQG